MKSIILATLFAYSVTASIFGQPKEYVSVTASSKVPIPTSTSLAYHTTTKTQDHWYTETAVETETEVANHYLTEILEKPVTETRVETETKISSVPVTYTKTQTQIQTQISKVPVTKIHTQINTQTSTVPVIVTPTISKYHLGATETLPTVPHAHVLADRLVVDVYTRKVSTSVNNNVNNAYHNGTIPLPVSSADTTIFRISVGWLMIVTMLCFIIHP